MEFSAQFCQGVMRYWNKRSYQRLEGSSKKNLKVVRLGGNTTTQRTRKVRSSHHKICLPTKILGGLRDAYMNSMLKVAGGTETAQGANTFGGKRIPRARTVKESTGDFETRLIVEVCKSIAASRQAVV